MFRSGLSALAALALALACCGLAQAERLSDPTRRSEPAAAGAEPVERWRLSATRMSGATRTAVINGRQVAEGEHLDGARVLRIEHGEVVLDEHGQQLRLSLFTTIGKQPVRRADSTHSSNPGSQQ